MSNLEEAQRTPAASETFARLESSVRRLIRQSEALRADLKAARERNRDLMGLLAPVAHGEESPESMVEKLRAAEAERQELRERLSRGRAVAERMMARIRFLEEQDG